MHGCLKKKERKKIVRASENCISWYIALNKVVLSLQDLEKKFSFTQSNLFKITMWQKLS